MSWPPRHHALLCLAPATAGTSPAAACKLPCPEQYVPVCGKDARTYANACAAACRGVAVASQGVCPKATESGASSPGRKPGAVRAALQVAHTRASRCCSMLGLPSMPTAVRRVEPRSSSHRFLCAPAAAACLGGRASQAACALHCTTPCVPRMARRSATHVKLAVRAPAWPPRACANQHQRPHRAPPAAACALPSIAPCAPPRAPRAAMHARQPAAARRLRGRATARRRRQSPRWSCRRARQHCLPSRHARPAACAWRCTRRCAAKTATRTATLARPAATRWRCRRRTSAAAAAAALAARQRLACSRCS